MRFLLVLLATLAASAGLAQFTSPKKGSPVRTAILDALRKPVEKDLGQKVQFKVDMLRVQGVWAFVKCRPKRPDGRKIDYSKTQYREAIAEGAFDDGVFALLKRKSGKWAVVKVSLGATDVPYVTWPEDFGAPRAIFDLPPGSQDHHSLLRETQNT